MRLWRGIVIERGLQGAIVGYGLWVAVGVPGAPGVVAVIAAIALIAVWIAVSLAQVGLALDIRGGRGDAMLLSGEIVGSDTLERTGDAALAESVAILGGLTVIAIALSVRGDTLGILTSGVFLLLFGLLEAVLVRARRLQRRGRKAWRALRVHQPEVALALLQRADLSRRGGANEAILASEAHLMRGDVLAAIGVLGPHLDLPAFAMRDAWLRLGRGDLGPARAVLALGPNDGLLGEVSHRALVAALAAAEGRGADVIAQEGEVNALLKRLPTEYGDPLRLGFAAACGQAGDLPRGRAMLAGLHRELAAYAYMGHAAPAWWALIQAAAGARVPIPAAAPAHRSVADDVFAPPKTDFGVAAPVRRPVEGAEPVRSLPIGVRRRPWIGILRLIRGPLVTILAATLLPVAALTAAMSGGDPVLVRFFGFAVCIAAFGASAALAGSWAEWLRRAGPGEGPVVALEDGTRVAVASFRRIIAVGYLERVVAFGMITAVPLVAVGPFDPYGWAGLPLAWLLWASNRPHLRGRQLVAAAAEGDSAEVLRLIATWRRAWVVVEATRHALAVHAALAHVRQGDPKAAHAELTQGGAIAEVRWCRVWLAAELTDAVTVERMLGDDTFGWWRLGALGFCLHAQRQPAEIVRRRAEWLDVADLIAGPFGDLLRIQVAAAHAAAGDLQQGLAIVAEHDLNVARFGWIGKTWPATGAAIRAIVA